MMQKVFDSALVVLWDDVNAPQLAVVTEAIDGPIVLVLPSSCRTTPAEGCLVCKVQPDGTLRKIGIGLGKSLNAVEEGDFFLAREAAIPRPNDERQCIINNRVLESARPVLL